jgi:hypothetical protein
MGALTLFALSPLVKSQQGGNDGNVSNPSVTFTLDFPQSNPGHYSISVDGAGHAHYECTEKVAEDAEEQTYRSDFEVSAGNREKMFALTKQAKYFVGDIDSKNTKLAFTGTKVLRYQDGQQSHTGSYNYSNSAPVRELTMLFQNMAGTLEYGYRLSYYHRYQKLALDDQLKRMEAQARNNELIELQSIAPVLQEIVDDPSVINVVRARAKDLIAMGSGATARR